MRKSNNRSRYHEVCLSFGFCELIRQSTEKVEVNALKDDGIL